MKVLKRQQFKGRKLVIKFLESEHEMLNQGVSTPYVLLLDGDVEWETESFKEMLEWIDSWKQDYQGGND